MNALLSEKIIRSAVRGQTVSIQIGRSRNFSSAYQAPIKIIEGDCAPQLVGRPFLKTNFIGRGGFKKILFTPSTRKIIVGRDWNPYDDDNH